MKLFRIVASLKGKDLQSWEIKLLFCMLGGELIISTFSWVPEYFYIEIIKYNEEILCNYEIIKTTLMEYGLFLHIYHGSVFKWIR